MGSSKEYVPRLALLRGGLIPLGRRKIAKEGVKFKIYLPKRMNDLWAELSEEGCEVEVYLAITAPPEKGAEKSDES